MPRKVLLISSDRDERRIFWGFEIFDSVFFLGKKIWQVFFGWLDLSRDFFGVLKMFLGSWCLECC